jgi:hypothetical protein
MDAMKAGNPHDYAKQQFIKGAVNSPTGTDFMGRLANGGEAVSTGFSSILSEL